MRLGRVADARIVTPEGVVEGDVTFDMDGGVIVDVGAASDAPVAWTLDARGAWVVPGGVDAHVHFGGFGPPRIADDFASGSRAALAGGTTTVIDFCEADGDESVRACVGRRMADARPSAVDYCFHFVLTERYDEQLRDLAYLDSIGMRDFKLFTIYDGETLSLDQVGDIFSRIGGDAGRTFLVHSEDAAEIARLRAAVADGRDFSELARTRPAETETRVAAGIRELAALHGARACIAHTSAASTAALEDAGAERLATGGVRVGEAGEFLLETCPHYLELTARSLEGPEGGLYTMTPPLRSDADRDALWELVCSGLPTVLSTDHCPYLRSQKLGSTWKTVPCGVDGVQSRMLLAFEGGVRRRGLSLRDYVRLTSETAARFYGLWPRKGAIAPGSDADLCVLDPGGVTPLVASDMRGDTDYTIYEGRCLSARVLATIHAGRLAFDGECVLAEPGSGRYLKA